MALLVVAGAVMVTQSNSGGFDSKAWQAQRGKHERDNPRAGMVVPLTRDHLRAGMRRAEVKALLGEPDQRRGQSDVYELGVSPVGVDEEYFVVEYDSDGKVTQFRVSRG